MDNLFKRNDDLLIRQSKILIIEDDRTQRMLLRAIFEDMGFNSILEAKNGEDGWQKTLTFDPDLVILDMNMPVMDGFDYCKKARGVKEYSDMTILVQTGLTDLENKAKIFDFGATDYITKPIDKNEIIARSFIHLKNTLNVKELKEYNRRVRKELFAAKHLIEVSLPQENAITEIKKSHKIDIAAKFESSQEMGGDFWGCYPIDTKKIAIYMIDVSGHGIDSALSALRIHTLLHANSDKFYKPGNILEFLNEKLFGLFPVGQFATMFFGIIDLDNDVISYSTASSTSPIILRNNKLSPELLSGKGYPLGAISNATFSTEYISFKQGDTLILYSDAITESLSKTKEMLGEDGLINMLETILIKQKSFNAKKTLNALLKIFHSECGKKLDDDLTVNFYHRLD